MYFTMINEGNPGNMAALHAYVSTIRYSRCGNVKRNQGFEIFVVFSTYNVHNTLCFFKNSSGAPLR